jgi:hypothetical protein
VAIVLAAWMLDPAICAATSLGPPGADIVGLSNLHRLLKTLGLRRTCSDEHSSIEEVHHAIAVASDCFDCGFRRKAARYSDLIAATVPI